MQMRAFAFGGLVGLPIAYALYSTIPAYAAYINWQFQHPLVLLLALPVGGLIAWITD